MNTAEAIIRTLESPNVCDRNFEAANVVDVISRLANSTLRIAEAITPRNTAPGRDACGGTVDSLTEAVMGLTAGMARIAESIESLASTYERVAWESRIASDASLVASKDKGHKHEK